MSLRDVTKGNIWPETLKLIFFQEMLDPLLKYTVFYVLVTHGVVFSLLDGPVLIFKNKRLFFSNFPHFCDFCSKLDVI